MKNYSNEENKNGDYISTGEKLSRIAKRESGGFFGFFITNFRFTYLIIATIIMLGGFALVTLPREADPEVRIPIAVVTTAYPGATPLDTEELITNKVEDKIKNLEDLNYFTSSSGSGISSVVIEYNAEAELEESFRKLREEVSKLDNVLPEDAESPLVTEIRANDRPIVTYSLVGDYSLEELGVFAESIKSELESIRGVSKVEITGKLDRQYKIVLDQKLLVNYNISLNQVIASVTRGNLNMPAGDIEIDGLNYNIRIKGKSKDIEDIAGIPIANKSGSSVYLKDVARVYDGYREAETVSRIGLPGHKFSQNTVSLQVYKKTGGNIIDIVEKSDNLVASLSSEGALPGSISVEKTNDESVYIEDSLSTLTRSGLQTMILIVILLLLVLGLRSALITALSVPIAFLMSFIWLDIQGSTLNGMVLFSLVLSLGLMVDNSIIIMEGIVEYREKHRRSPREAAVLSVWNFKWPVIAGTMTTVSAFAPMLLVSGIMGEYMSVLPKTISATLISSLFVALVVVPTLAARRPDKLRSSISREDKKKYFDFSHLNLVTPFIEKIKPRYRSFMQSLLPYKKKRRRFVICAWSLFLFSAIILATGLIRVEMFPPTDMPFFQVNIEMSPGTSLEVTEQKTLEIEKLVSSIPELETYTTNIGILTSFYGDSARGSHYSTITINLLDENDRDRESFEVAGELREQLKSVTGAKITVEELNAGPPTGAPIELRIYGSDIEKLAHLADDFTAVLAELPGVYNIKTNLLSSTGEINFNINKDKISYYGFDVATVASHLRTAIYGTTISTVNIDGDDVDIVVSYNDDNLKSVNDVKNITLMSPQGQFINLGQLADITLEPALLSISHRDGDRLVRITASLEKGGNLPKTISSLNKKAENLDIPEGYKYIVGGESEDVDKSFREIFTSMIVAVILIFAILILQFNSFKQPFIIIFTVPLSIIGVVAGLFLLRLPFSLPAFIGIVSLSGIVVNDAIVLVDQINKNIKDGTDLTVAIIRGGESRMQPIFLTTITTVAGIFPLTFADELWKGLGWTVIFGLAFSTILTLVMVPILYVSFFDRKKNNL